jgi:2',3'-cyclic-nucleotide 2'-phosphodiesterase (5'-nucleotidase family)
VSRIPYITILLFFIFSCTQHYSLVEPQKAKGIDYSLEKEDSSLVAMISPYKTKLETEMNEVVGYLGEDMDRGYPEGKLGNLAADIFYRRAGEEMKLDPAKSFCLVNNGGLRVSLKKGQISRGKAFELLPFENYLCALSLSGKELVSKLGPYLIEKKGQPVSANVFIVFEGKKIKRFELDGKPIDSLTRYVIVTNDYLSNGGDNMDFFLNGTNRHDFESIKLRDCFIEYLKKYSGEKDSIRSTRFGRMEMN